MGFGWDQANELEMINVLSNTATISNPSILSHRKPLYDEYRGVPFNV